jgi:quercetin dioxygenase-like cupin family protein
MRQLVTGTDADGRSCVVRELQLQRSGPDTERHVVYLTDDPPAPRPTGHGELTDLGVPPGVVRLSMNFGAAGTTTGVHHTDTVDFHTVLEGSIDLILDDGPHHLAAGDSIVVAGVDHSWQVGPSGCTMASVFLGTPGPSS